MDWFFSNERWSPEVVTMYVLPNIVIAVCYWWIPFNGLLYWKYHREGLGQHKTMLFWYSAFIFSCGLTRFVNVLTFRHPFDILYIVFLNLTALLSFKAAWHTREFLKDAIKLPSRKELHDAIDRFSSEKLLKDVAEREKDAYIRDQKETIEKLKDIIETQVWIYDKDLALKELNSMIERMNK